MIFVTGGMSSGKRSYVCGLGYGADQMADGVLDDAPVALNAQELVRAMEGGKEADVTAIVDALASKDVVTCTEMGNGVVPLDASERAWRDRAGKLACELAARADVAVRMVCGVPVVLKGNCSPVASGNAQSLKQSSLADARCGTRLVSAPQGDVPDGGSATSCAGHPADSAADASEAPSETPRSATSPSARALRSSLANEEESVQRVSSGASDAPAAQTRGPVDSVELVIMRHGATKGNEERRYVGVVDVPLSPLGCSQAVAAGIHPEIDRVYVTTLIRSQQTAAICFPCAQQVIVDGLQEMNFGVFAGRTADEMVDDAEYRAWVDGNCEGQCPGGESRAQVTNRICRALGKLIVAAQNAGEERVILVAHGGTMMSALDRYSVDHPERDYYAWNTGNCKGYVLKAQVTKGGTLTLDECRPFDNLDFLYE